MFLQKHGFWVRIFLFVVYNWCTFDQINFCTHSDSVQPRSKDLQSNLWFMEMLCFSLYLDSISAVWVCVVLFNRTMLSWQDPKVEGWLIESMQFNEQRDRLAKHLTTQKNYFSQSRQDSSYILRFKKVDTVSWCCAMHEPTLNVRTLCFKPQPSAMKDSHCLRASLC